MPGIDWKSQDAFQRLLAATVASFEGQAKLNYKRIADFYGEGATYDAIEGRFRIVKKQAAKLKEEIENGRPIAPPRGRPRSTETTPRKPKTPRNNQSSQEGVLSGRVSKSNPNTPTKRRPNAQVKREMMESMTVSSTSASTSASSVGTEVDTPTSHDANDSILIDESSFHAYPPFDAASFEMLVSAPPNMSHGNTMGDESYWEDFENAV